MAFLGTGTSRSLRFGLAIVLLASALGVSAQDGYVEDEVKAVFILNFAKYVSWPPAALGETQAAPIRLCLAAATDFIATVKTAIAGESVDGRPLVTATPSTIDEARSCHILYVSKAETSRMRPILDALRTTPILTIVDGPSLKDDGSVIVLVRDQNRVRFDVSRPAASSKGLSISSKLLRLARRVQEQ
jgi:hypothetical protein